ncbi:hypothetical protein KI387_018385, partial [Taxus chinensis]
ESKSLHGDMDGKAVHRSVVRLGLPSKGQMADDALALLKDCQLGIRQANPRQYVAHVPGLSNLEVWFQRPKRYCVETSQWGISILVSLDMTQSLNTD